MVIKTATSGKSLVKAFRKALVDYETKTPALYHGMVHGPEQLKQVVESGGIRPASRSMEGEGVNFSIGAPLPGFWTHGGVKVPYSSSTVPGKTTQNHLQAAQLARLSPDETWTMLRDLKATALRPDKVPATEFSAVYTNLVPRKGKGLDAFVESALKLNKQYGTPVKPNAANQGLDYVLRSDKPGKAVSEVEKLLKDTAKTHYMPSQPLPEQFKRAAYTFGFKLAIEATTAKTYGGLKFRIDRPKGYVKKWEDSGKEFTYPCDYGYFTKLIGEDAEGLDAFVGNESENTGIFESFLKLKKDSSGKLVPDETKFLIGVTPEQRKKIYELYGSEVSARTKYMDIDGIKEAIKRFKGAKKVRYQK